MTTSASRPRRAAAGLWRGAAVAAAIAVCCGPAGADPAAPADAGQDSTAHAVLRVTSLPSGLAVLVDSIPIGTTPTDSLLFPPGTVLVRVLAADPRRFDPARDAVVVTLRGGVTTSVFLDVRPSILLRSDPEPAFVHLAGGETGLPDTLLGETPLQIRPSMLETGRIRFSKAAYADTILPGISPAADSVVSVRVRLRRAPSLAAPPPSIGRSRPIYRRAWFQWSLIGIGAALSGLAVAYHNEADAAYEEYLESSDASEIPDLYDEAVQYDRKAAVSLGVGQACFVSGLILLVTGQR